MEIAEFTRSLPPELIADLDAAPPLAARAALAIGRSKKAEGAGPLRAHLGATDPGLRAMAVYALGLLADAGSLPAVRAATLDANSAVRYAAADALGRIYAVAPPGTLARDQASQLLTLGRTDSDPVVRGHAVAQLDAFRKLPYARAVALRLQAIERDDPDPDVRWHAAWMLFRSYAKFADLTFLARAAHDPEELVRVETVRALAHRKETIRAGTRTFVPAALAIVRPLLADPSWRVQFEAREAIRRLELEPPTDHLRTMPAGIHLPALADSPATASETPEPDASAGPRPTTAAPDPATFSLGAPLEPHSASDLDGPAPGPHPRVLLRTTKGDVVVRLYPEWAPSTVANFIALSQSGYFDNNRWFRIVPNFVTQTGDPTGDPDAEAGYTIPAEENPVEQRSGIIAMGLDYKDNKPLRDSAGTQFYITLSPQPYLGRDFSVFGEVESGFDVIANLIESDRMTLVRRIADD